MTGSALLDEIHAKRLAFRKATWPLSKPLPPPPQPTPPPAPKPPVLWPPLPSALIEDIQTLVASHLNVSLGDILSTRRTKDVVLARHIAIYLARVLTRQPFQEIGRRFGGRWHTTIIHAVRKIKRLIKTDAAVAVEILCLKKRFESEDRSQTTRFCA